jgi:hypothetical protein
MGDAIDFQIHMKTPVEKLGILKERMQRYIESLPQFWYPDFRILCDKVIDCNKVNMMIWMRHRINYQVCHDLCLTFLSQQFECRKCNKINACFTDPIMCVVCIN